MSVSDPFATTARRVMVFGHPSHELALYGLLSRHRPHVVLLTDGGGGERVRQSREGLGALGLLDRTTYLGFSEASFYEALLERDPAALRDAADALRAVMEPLEPEQVFCDAVELYNPVHDVTRPIVERARRGLPPAELWEVPLAYQVPADEERYDVQRVPESMAARRRRYALAPDEVERKVRARDVVYTNLRGPVGPDFLRVPREHLAVEEIARADATVDPREGRVLRYEWRARRLLAEGRIARAITYEGHFLPTTAALAAS
jgi:LmbE family N-acetylglucosaminyl deacetylase